MNKHQNTLHQHCLILSFTSVNHTQMQPNPSIYVGSTALISLTWLVITAPFSYCWLLSFKISFSYMTLYFVMCFFSSFIGFVFDQRGPVLISRFFFFFFALYKYSGGHKCMGIVKIEQKATHCRTTTSPSVIKATKNSNAPKNTMFSLTMFSCNCRAHVDILFTSDLGSIIARFF